MASEEVEVLVTPAAQKRRARPVTVEPFLILLLYIQGGFAALRTLYIEHRLAVSYNYTLPTNNVNSTCDVNATKDPTQEKIESETAIWVAYMKDVSVFLPLFGALIYGTASDFIGRKPILVISAIGHLAASALFTCVAYFNLPLVCLVIGEVVLGVCGDTAVADSTSYAYITDIYHGKSRSFRIFLLNVIAYVGYGGSQIVVTSILQATSSNYSITFSTLFVVAIVNFLYVTVPRVLLETVDKRPFSRGVLRDLISKIYRLFKSNANGRRLSISLLMANMVLFHLVYEALFSVITIYGLGPPFCWNDTLVGVYAVIVYIAPALASLLALKLLGLCMSEYCMIYIGFLSGIGLLVTTSLADTTPILAYVAPAVGLLRVLPTGILKFLTSQQVDHDEEGSLFGAIAVVTSVGKFFSPVLINGIYSTAVKVGHATVTFYVAAGILVIPLIINGFLHVSKHRRGEYQPINISEDEENEIKVPS